MRFSFTPSRFPLTSLILCGLFSAGLSHAAGLRVVPSYENASVYVDAAKDIAPNTLRVFYREAGASTWLSAHELVASANDTVPRGSLFGLRQNGTYEVRCEDADGREVADGRFQTWADEVPIARTINIRELSPDGGPVLIDIGGKPDGWIRYVSDPGFVINGGAIDDEAVLIENLQYVILDGLTVRGGHSHGIQVRNSEHIRIRNCDISGFGRVGKQDLTRHGQYFMPGSTKAINYDAGIFVNLSGNFTIEHNYIHDPRSRANSWFYGHPAGPDAILVRSTGSMVIRYNDLIGSMEHRWNDAIEGYGNDKFDGGFNRDSDIYGNYLAFANDDGIELDGGQCNVRFYGNKIEGGLCGISTAVNARGPSYVFNNLVANLAEESGAASAAVKNGGGTTNTRGTTYFYHNTFFTFGNGVTAVGYGSDKNRGMFFGHTRNNVFVTTGLGINDTVRPPGNTYDYDVFAKPDGGPGEYAVSGEVEAHGKSMAVQLIDAPSGNFVLSTDTPATGERIAGFDFLQNTSVVTPGIGSAEMPARPNASFTLDKGQLTLTTYAGQESASGSGTITIKSLDPTRAQPFIVKKNVATGWLQVEPASGTLPPNGEVTVTVRFNDSGRVGRGLQLGALVIQTEDGNSRPVTVYGLASAERVRRLFEAESLPGANDFKIESVADASGGKAIQFADPIAAKSGKGKKSLTVPIELTADGAIYVAFRVRAPQPYGNHDSMFISLNGEPVRLGVLSVSGNWQWSRLTGQAMHLELSAGTHSLRVIPREDVELDAILVSDSPLMAGDQLERFLKEN